MVEQQLAKQERLQAQNERLALQLVAAPVVPSDHSLTDAESLCKKTESQAASRIMVRFFLWMDKVLLYHSTICSTRYLLPLNI